MGAASSTGAGVRLHGRPKERKVAFHHLWGCSPAHQRLLSFIFMPPSATMVGAQFFEAPSKRGVDSTCEEAAFSQDLSCIASE